MFDNDNAGPREAFFFLTLDLWVIFFFFDVKVKMKLHFFLKLRIKMSLEMILKTHFDFIFTLHFGLKKQID